MHSISDDYISRVNRRRSLYVGFGIFTSIIAYRVWQDGSVSTQTLVISLVCAFIFGVGRGKHTWASGLVEEAQWTIERGDSSLIFHYRGGSAHIEGKDIEKIKSKMKGHDVVWFDVYYKDQVTRIKHYSGINQLYLHALKIRDRSTKVEEIR